MGFSRQESQSGLPSPFTGDLPNPGIKPGSPALQADTLPSKPPGEGSREVYRDLFTALVGGIPGKATTVMVEAEL